MKNVAIDEFCNFTFLSNVTFSPDGKSLAYTVSEINKEADRYESRIYLRKGNKTVRLTNGGKESSFRFIDNKTIVFRSNREEKSDSTVSHYYKISVDGGEAEKFLTLPIPTGKIIPLSNGDFIVEGQTYPGFEELYTGDAKIKEAFEKYRKENADYHILTQNPWWFNGDTFTDGTYTSLFYYTAKTGKLRRISAVGTEAQGAELSADEKYIFYAARPVKPLDMMDENGFYRMELASGRVDTIIEPTNKFYLTHFVLCKDYIVMSAVVPTHGINTNSDFYKVDYDTLEISAYAKWGEALGSSVGTDVRRGGGRIMKSEGNTVYFIATIFDSAYLCKLENGKIERISEKEGSVDTFDVYGDKICVSAFWDMKGAELYELGGKQLTKYNEKLLRGKYVAMPEKLNFVTDGHEIHGFVLKPMDYDENNTYPVIFDIHGGPKTVYGEVYYHEMQYWAGKGYFVIFCNPTGSDGRGNEFMDIRGKYGTVDYDDLMAFCDAALEKYPQMDRERVFETGGSYGGFMTNWIIGHTDRFRACASQRSISNWFSFYGVSDIGTVFANDQCAADVWLSPEKLWWHSPLRYADKVKTPTLFIHSEEDYRCPIDQGYQMFTALLAHGVESKLVEFKGENHDLSRSGKPSHRIKRLKEISDWFEQHDIKKV